MPMNGSASAVLGQVPVVFGAGPGVGPVNRSLIHPVALNFGSPAEGADAGGTCGDD
ncbi:MULTISPECIES: hypothetical protein [unclassified Kitasatospora]|uniref:hypothetical protein n=1 Tax=unclassified Kitasatospora TaxID=2633591 RepID=UPI0033DE7909